MAKKAFLFSLLCAIAVLLGGVAWVLSPQPKALPKASPTKEFTPYLGDHRAFLAHELAKTQAVLQHLVAQPLPQLSGSLIKERKAFLATNHRMQRSLLEVKAALLTILLDQGQQLAYLLKGLILLVGVVVAFNMGLLSLWLLKRRRQLAPIHQLTPIFLQAFGMLVEWVGMHRRK